MVCFIWWLLLGILIGLLIYWFVDKLFLRDENEQNDDIQAEYKRLQSEHANMRNELDTIKAENDAANKKESLMGEASKYGFTPMKKGKDNLTLVEGIGPKIEGLLHAQNILTFKDLAVANIDNLQSILDAAGSRFKLARPKTWPLQAEYCVKSDWKGLKEYQDYLDGGVDLADKQSDKE